jgi:type IV pilus assembly protein PilO
VKKLLNKLAEKPRKQLIAMAAGSVLAILLVYWFYFYKNISYEKSDLAQEILDLERQIQDEKNIAQNLHQYKKEVEILDNKLELVLLELPDKKEIEGFLESVSVLAQDNGLEVIKFSPQPTELREFFAAVPANIELQGTFHQLVTFFDEVAHLSRIININNITINIVTEKNKDVIIRASCIATTFRYLDEQEQLLVKEQKVQERKRR